MIALVIWNDVSNEIMINALMGVVLKRLNLRIATHVHDISGVFYVIQLLIFSWWIDTI